MTKYYKVEIIPKIGGFLKMPQNAILSAPGGRRNDYLH